VTVKEELHELIEGLSEDQAAELLRDLRDASDAGGAPLSAESLASLERGIADIAVGRVITLEEFERKNPL